MHQDATHHGARPRPRRLCVRWGPRSPPQKEAEPPKFSAHVYCVKTDGWIKMVLGVEVGLSPGVFVLDGDSPPPKYGVEPPPQFSAYFYCGQTAGCIRYATWLGGRPQPRGLCVRWGPSPLPKKGAELLRNFRPMSTGNCGQTAVWIKMALGTEVGLGPDDIVLDGDPAPPSPKSGQSPLTIFRPMSIVAKLLDGSRWHLAWRWALVQATGQSPPPPIFGPCLL